jgi:XisI protein
METLSLNRSQSLEEWRHAIDRILSDYMHCLNLDDAIRVYLITSQDRNHFMLMHEGWLGHERLHGAIVHVEIRDDKIWIHFDGSEEGITDELVASGVPKDRIVLAFHAPDVRPHTGYAVG